MKTFGAKGDGITDDTVAIQAAIDYVGGVGGLASVTGRHGRLFFPSGVYKTTAQLTIKGSTWVEIFGESAKGTYVYQQGGTGACIQVQGSFYQNASAVRKSSEFDAGGLIHDISIGSNVGHAFSYLNAYRSKFRNVLLFSAGVTSNFLDIDGCSIIDGDDLSTNGNDVFPLEWATTLLSGRTQGVYGVYITCRVDGDGRYNLSGEITFNRPKIQAQQTQDGIYVYTPSGADFQIYPVTINDPDIVGKNGYSNIKANKAIVIVNGGYGETTSPGDVVDAIECLTTQGPTTVYVNNHVAPTCRLNLNGNGVNKPSIIAKGGYFSTFLSASAVYGTFSMSDVQFVSDTASAYAAYTGGDYTSLTGNFMTVAGVNVPLASYQEWWGYGGNANVQKITYSAASGASATLEYRKSRGTPITVAAIQAGDALLSRIFKGYYNAGWRQAGYEEVLAASVSASLVEGSWNLHLTDVAGADRVPLTVGAYYLTIPRITTAEKNTITPVNGMIVYDTTLGKFQGYEAGAWTSLI